MTRRRPSAWATVIGAFALFGVVFQLLLFQATPGGAGSLLGGISLTGDDLSGGDDGVPAKSISVASAHSAAPAPVTSSTS
ncbi:MAG: hypothetical protein WB771_01685 [Solirubrobacterales bacterium]